MVLLFTNKEELVADVEVDVSLACKDQEIRVYDPEKNDQDEQQHYRLQDSTSQHVEGSV